MLVTTAQEETTSKIRQLRFAQEGDTVRLGHPHRPPAPMAHSVMLPETHWSLTAPTAQQV